MTIAIERARCTGCSYCVITCPSAAITLEIGAEVWPHIDETRCTLCGECVYACPNNVFSAPTLRPPQAELAERYDVVVVGAALAG